MIHEPDYALPTSEIPITPANASSDFEALVADIIAERTSIIDLMRSSPKGDYFAYVQQQRLLIMLVTDPRVMKRFWLELREKIVEVGVDPDNPDIEKELKRKGGTKRFFKLSEERSRTINTQASLLTASAFPARLEQYKVLIAHVEKLWSDACELYIRRNFPIAAFIYILVIEEIGKLSSLSVELIYMDSPVSANVAKAIEKKHSKKHFVGVVSGALINTRLDRVLGKAKVRRILNEVDNNALEKTRQRCLYIDMENGRAVTPGERIDENHARDLTILAGELMAEVLGHFPWNFERMINDVIAYERQIGLPEAKIEQR